MHLPAERAEFTEAAKGERDFTRRRFRIRKEDLETFGCTAGCPGFRAVNRGTTATNHSEECRKRLGEELEKVGGERLARETERLFEHLEEEESIKEIARASESSKDGKPSASSSGPATAEKEVPRSRRGAPMARDSGDSVPETAKRKIGDSEP